MFNKLFIIAILLILSLILPAQDISINGQALDKKSNPISNALVSYYSEGNLLLDSTRSIVDGTFELTLVHTGINTRRQSNDPFLKLPHPNPFNGLCNFTISTNSKTKIVVSNMQGIMVDRLEIKQAGIYNCAWGGQNRIGQNVNSGTYNISVVTNNNVFTRKVIFSGNASQRIKSERITELTLGLLLSVLGVKGQVYYQKNIEAHQTILGTEIEEFARDGVAATQYGNVGYNTLGVNGLHAILEENTPYYDDGKTYFVTKFGDYSSDEITALEGSNGFGIKIDTINKTIKDYNENLLDTFENSDEFKQDMVQIIDNIVKLDIDVTPVGINEMNKIIHTYLNRNIVNNIYPNPTNGKVNIDLKDGMKDIGLVICNIAGQIVKEYNLDSDVQIDLDEFSKGVYFMQFQNKSMKQTEKIIKH